MSTTHGNHPWWESAVIYQIYPRSFADSDTDGIGDLQGVIEHLDHLQRLGVDALWLSPIYPSPQVDNGYDISDYQGIDPSFGDLATFDRLVREAHARGIRIVLDVVANHTSDQHPWFQESRANRSNPKRDWYWWRPARPGRRAGEPGAEPTNWWSFFSGPTWTLDDTTGEYYLHLFAAQQPDLNWENPQVRAAIALMMRWWLDRGVDGFRMDVINLVSKDPALPDGEYWSERFGDGSPHFANGPRIHEYLRELREEVRGNRDGDFLIVGETPRCDAAQVADYTDASRAELDMAFQFEHVNLGGSPDKYQAGELTPGALVDSLSKWQEALSERGWNALYLANHDQPRPVSRFGDDSPQWRVASAKALATMLHLLRGTPFIHQGEELAMTNHPFQGIDDFRDVEALNYWRQALATGRDPEQVLAGLRRRGRDNARTPMQWTAGTNAGFSTATPWLPVNPNHVEINAAAQLDDPASVFNHYRLLIELRHELPAISHGTFTRLDTGNPSVFRFQRHVPGQCVTVTVNLSSQPQQFSLDGGQSTMQPWGQTLLLEEEGRPTIPLMV